ncbi:RMD1 family protein [Clostridium sp. YIM B02505]|uniref:RMD1 family protein n=1 Tax=Clostridium yunnanense TaxID=2800325 RepID=A0ABS1EJV3_9CLOT|nr:RMD1 family protein [Clostridium yunnanense]MBK1809648.1 RMD1 family protein [Clostridium yunnanense]
MKEYLFKARAICSEFSISNIAKRFDINRKIKWEEPLILKGSQLQGYVKNIEDKAVYIYHFGSIVFVNFTNDEIDDFINIIKLTPNSIKSLNKYMKYQCREDFRVVLHEHMEEQLEYESLVINSIDEHHFSMTALVVAKSVALETIEVTMDVVFDEVEKIIKSLESGNLNINEKQAASIIGRVLSFKHTTISYIMLLDKPAIAWKNESAENLFNDLADLFELNDRYEKLNAKSQTMVDIIEIFANLSHSKRANNLEIIVILLILIEVIMAFRDLIFR